MKFESWYDKNYKKLLIVPFLLLSLSIIYIGVFYIQNGDVIHKDISLTGGTSLTIKTGVSAQELGAAISKNFTDFTIKTISDNSGKQTELTITIAQYNSKVLQKIVEDYLGFKLTSQNSSVEMTSASLSADFYKQLITAVLLAFFWMAAVVFIIFSKNRKAKFWTLLLNLLLGFFMGHFFLKIGNMASVGIFLIFAVILIWIYIKNSTPSFAVMLSAFGDIVMTLAVVDIIGMKISTAGIVAFLMLIGYSVDTDVLLTTRLLKKHSNTNSALFGAFKTGITMTATSIIAITTALIAVFSFGSVLNQIFSILIIGLLFDIFNTWVTNASIIKWYVEVNK